MGNGGQGISKMEGKPWQKKKNLAGLYPHTWGLCRTEFMSNELGSPGEISQR